MGRALYGALYGPEGCRYGKPSNWLHIADRLAVGLGTTGSQPVTSATGTSPMTGVYITVESILGLKTF